jgi:hypothetical protein
MQATRVRSRYIAFEDWTLPDQRTFGFYEVKVIGTAFAQVIRASHRTAARLARSRTQYGDARLYFLEPIDTPALD